MGSENCTYTSCQKLKKPCTVEDSYLWTEMVLKLACIHMPLYCYHCFIAFVHLCVSI